MLDVSFWESSGRYVDVVRTQAMDILLESGDSGALLVTTVPPATDTQRTADEEGKELLRVIPIGIPFSAQ